MDKRGQWQHNRRLALKWLKKTFPLAFNKITPLKIGIDKDIFAHTSDDMPSRVWIRRALMMHTRKNAYLQRLSSGKKRIDLNGEPCGVVTEDQARLAKQILMSKGNKTKTTKQVKVLSPMVINVDTSASQKKLLLLKRKFETNVS